MESPDIGAFSRLVIKIGSALLTDEAGQVNRAWLASLAADVAALRQEGQEVLLVSSGAIAIGSRLLGIDRRRSRLEELQAAAAAGQAKLVEAYQDVLAVHGIHVAQILLTLDDSEDRRRFLNARGTLEKLLAHGVVPVVNENDTVATEEIRYGDNDRLAARVGQMVMADGLLLLSDIDGLYTADPRRDAGASHVPVVGEVTTDLEAMAGDTRTGTGSGGMTTKLQAARIASQAGCSTLIANGLLLNPIAALQRGEARCTLFPARSTPARARKQWLAGGLAVRGRLELDDGAIGALARGMSLLPVGVMAVSGDFRRGDPVAIVSRGGVELGRGLVAYESVEAARIAGCRSEEIEDRLGYRGRSVMIHRDDLVMFAERP